MSGFSDSVSRPPRTGHTGHSGIDGCGRSHGSGVLGGAIAVAPVAPLAVFVGCASRTPEAPAGKPAARIAVDASAADPAAAAPPVASLEPEALCRGNTTLADAERGHRDWQAQLAELVKDGQEPQGPEEYRVHSKDRCGVAKNNVDASMKAILAAPAPKARAATVRAGWDRRTPPKYMDLVQRRLRPPCSRLRSRSAGTAGRC